MKLSPRLDATTPLGEIELSPTPDEWSALSAICPERLLEGDRDGLTYLELCAAQDAALLASDAKARLVKIAKALAALQAVLAYPPDGDGFAVASHTETLLDDALDQRLEGLTIDRLVSTLTAVGEATSRVTTDLDAIPSPEGQSEAKEWLYASLFEFFELKRWPTSHRCDNIAPEDAPAFTQFTARLLQMLGKLGPHFVMASIGRDIARSKAARTRTSA